VRLGIPDDYAEVFMPAIMEGFARKHPFVEVSVICEGSLALAERIRSHELDIALLTDCAAIHNVEVVRREPLVWVAHPRFTSNGEASNERCQTCPGWPNPKCLRFVSRSCIAQDLNHHLLEVSQNPLICENQLYGQSKVKDH